MNSERLNQIEEIYQAVLKISPDEREAFFNEICGVDVDLRREVESLLAFEKNSEIFLDNPPESLVAQMFAEQENQIDLLGKKIGHYKIIKLLGKGGMGEVFLAQDTKLDRKVAIKFLNVEFSKDVNKLKRFIQEAKAVSALNHPNILTVHEIGETDGTNYIVTEFIEGKTLREHLLSEETNSLNSILKIGVQVAEALSAAHQTGIIHRDIKPENIMIRADGYAKVLDFGLAKLSEPSPSTGRSIDLEDTTKGLVKTNPGMVMGTVSYMSPEQARGKETDSRTDIWSLGIVLYEMLAGKVPFTGETINHTIVSILEKVPFLLENVPDELQRIVRKTLTKEVEMRYQTARDLLIDLKNLRRDLDIQGELERSIVPHRETLTDLARENETLTYSPKSTEETNAKTAQQMTTSSSLEYAVTQAKSHKFTAAIIGIILLSVISAVTYFGFFANSSKQIESIAVMPFVNESGNQDVEYLSDGMTETLISRLSQLPNLSVKARSTVFYYKGKEISTKKIGEELNVQAVLLGRILQRGEDLKLNLELVNPQTQDVIWSEQYYRKQTDLITLQTEIVREVSGKLKSKLSGADEAKVEKNYTTDTEAYQFYLKGRFYWNKRTAESLKQAVGYFNQAIEKDPNFALAYVGLADSYVLFSGYAVSSPQESFPLAKKAAQKAIELDDSLAEAHTSLGYVLFNYDWNFAESEKEMRRAIELNPNYSTAYHWYGNANLLAIGKLDESIKRISRAQELDPLSLIINADLATSYLYAGQLEMAVKQYEKTLELDENFQYARTNLGRTYMMKGEFEKASQEFEKALTLGNDPRVLMLFACNYSRMGKQSEALEKIEELKKMSNEKYVSPYFFALAYTSLGDKNKAFELLQKAFVAREGRMTLIKADPLLDDLHSDPRFKDLIRRMGLPE